MVTFIFIFKISLLSLLYAIFSNRYRQVKINLNALKRYTLIEKKNRMLYDKSYGAVTCSFFPLNILMLPFLLPVLYYKSEKLSDNILKAQYATMSIFYTLLLMVAALILLPICYIKIIVNSFYLMALGKK